MVDGDFVNGLKGCSGGPREMGVVKMNSGKYVGWCDDLK